MSLCIWVPIPSKCLVRAPVTRRSHSPILTCLFWASPLSAQQRGAADEAFDQSSLPFRVDIVEAARIAPSFLQPIEPKLTDLP